jgi:hypothetical protein
MKVVTVYHISMSVFDQVFLNDYYILGSSQFLSTTPKYYFSQTVPYLVSRLVQIPDKCTCLGYLVRGSNWALQNFSAPWKNVGELWQHLKLLFQFN